MTKKIYVLLLSVLLMACHKEENGITYVPRVLTANEDFNTYHQENDNQLVISKYDDSNGGGTGKNPGGLKDWFGVKFGNADVRIESGTEDQKIISDQFAFAEFMNTEKTCVLVQIANQSGLAAPVYLLSVKNHKLEVVSLSRPSKGGDDLRFMKGLTRIGNAGYIVNNDFLITRVTAKAYVLRRQNPEQRIQGEFILSSPDLKTLVFLTGSSLYELYYPTGEVFTQPLPKGMPSDVAEGYQWIQDNSQWAKNSKGISFLKALDPDRIVDIKSFK